MLCNFLEQRGSKFEGQVAGSALRTVGGRERHRLSYKEYLLRCPQWHGIPGRQPAQNTSNKHLLDTALGDQ